MSDKKEIADLEKVAETEESVTLELPDGEQVEVNKEELVDETIEEPKVEPTKEEPKAKKKADLIDREKVLELLNKASVQLTRKTGNSITVPTRELRALLNGLTEDVKAL